MIVSSNLHVYVSQTAKGELVIGSEVDPYQTYCIGSTLPTLEQMATYTLELFPQLHGIKILAPVGGSVRHDSRLCSYHGRGAGTG